MHSSPLVGVVILNTNRLADTTACLESLAQSDYPAVDILVVDNASSDGSAERIPQRFPQVALIRSDRNLGYTGGNNLGVRQTLSRGADYVFVLNEDTVVHDHCLSQLVEAAEQDPHIGMAGPMTYDYPDTGRIQSAGAVLTPLGATIHRGRDEKDIGQFAAVEDVDWVQGSAILVRRQVIERIGLLDEHFFMSWEDTDWCARSREAGYRVVFVPQARLWHKGAGHEQRRTPQMTYYRGRNRLLYMRKHGAGPLKLLRVLLTVYLRTLVSWTVNPRWRSYRAERDALALAVWHFIRGKSGPVEIAPQ